MSWTEIHITVPSKDVDLASGIANMVVPHGIYIEDYSDMEKDIIYISQSKIIDNSLLAKDKNKAIIHVYLEEDKNPNEAVSFLKERFSSANINYEVNLNIVSDEDWANNWKKFFKPIEIGNKLLISPTWEDVCKTDRSVLKIDPGLAFGTGSHETTRLVLEVMEDVIKKGDQVLDIGTGSGILSIASLLLGAEKVTGVDIDEIAVKTAIENGKVNGFSSPEYTVIKGDLLNHISAKFDIVLANIVADTIIELCKDVRHFMKENSYFIPSGIITMREDEVKKALLDADFEILERHQDRDWVCFLCR